MECPRCHFQNIPGQERCFKCNSILEVQGSALEIYPPRMHQAERSLRAMGRFMRRIYFRFNKKKLESGHAIKEPKPSFPMIGLILSMVPGFAHFITKRFTEIRVVWFVWLALFAVGLIFHRHAVAWALLGGAAACHAYIAVKVELWDYLQEWGGRLICLLVITLILAVVYLLLPTLWGSSIPDIFPRFEWRRTDAGNQILDYSTAVVGMSTMMQRESENLHVELSLEDLCG